MKSVNVIGRSIVNNEQLPKTVTLVFIAVTCFSHVLFIKTDDFNTKFVEEQVGSSQGLENAASNLSFSASLSNMHFVKGCHEFWIDSQKQGKTI